MAGRRHRLMSGPTPPLPLGTTEFHVLLVLMEGPLYGYAIQKAVAEESGGAVSPQIGSLYRVLARLLSQGMVMETKPPSSAPDVHPGLDRKYYGLTARGESAARAEAARLADLVELARRRALLPQGGRP
jgi:DNA-binding PadR family transcriptional regulator